jgi:hypothetical protein
MSAASKPDGPQNFRRLLRIQFRNPKEDYRFVQEIRSSQGAIVHHQNHCARLAVIRKSLHPASLGLLELIARLRHSNIAEILDVYFHDDQLSIVSEYLDISLIDMKFDRVAPAEWEVATIAAEVSLLSSQNLQVTKSEKILKGMTYLSDSVSCCEIYVDEVKLSPLGDVKLSRLFLPFPSQADYVVPDIYYAKSKEGRIPDPQNNLASFAAILEILTLRGTSSDEGWSEEALDFASISSPNSLSLYVNVSLYV